MNSFNKFVVLSWIAIILIGCGSDDDKGVYDDMFDRIARSSV